MWLLALNVQVHLLLEPLVGEVPIAHPLVHVFYHLRIRHLILKLTETGLRFKLLLTDSGLILILFLPNLFDPDLLKIHRLRFKILF